MPGTLFSLPSVSGVDINGVFYRYTVTKDANTPYTVSIQNENAIDGGYIFRETDDWSGGSGGTIQKFVPVPYSPLGDWGEGSIDEVGLGTLTDPTVLYSYRYDPSVAQQDIPGLPPNPLPLPYDAMADSAVMDALKPTDPDFYEYDETKDSEKEEEDESQLEAALAAQTNALTIANSVTQSQLLLAMNTATDLSGYYAKKLQGGKYQEAIVLKDKNIPDNRRAFRSLGQQKLHTDMVNQQYGR